MNERYAERTAKLAELTGDRTVEYYENNADGLFPPTRYCVRYKAGDDTRGHEGPVDAFDAEYVACLIRGSQQSASESVRK